MTRVSGVVLAISLAACAACGAASSQEIQTARSARYTCGLEQVHDAAGKAMEEVFYRVGSSSAEAGIVRSETRWYEESGMPRERGAAVVDDKDVLISVEVRVIKDGSSHTVSIAADVVEYLEGSPQGRRLAPDDPNRPTWVQGKLDRMAVLIHESLQGCAHVSAHSSVHKEIGENIVADVDAPKSRSSWPPGQRNVACADRDGLMHRSTLPSCPVEGYTLSMTEVVRKHLDEILKLPREERALVIDELLASVDARDAADDEDLLGPQETDEDPAMVRDAWREEIKRRIEARGPYVSADEVHTSIDAELAALQRKGRTSRG